MCALRTKKCEENSALDVVLQAQQCDLTDDFLQKRAQNAMHALKKDGWKGKQH